jgi:hypothetical protein
MLSSALRHGTTEHVSPAQSQGLDWWREQSGRFPITKEEAYNHNIAEMARQEASMSFEKIPGLSKYSFDFDNGTFHDENGKPVKDSDIEQTIKARDPRFEEGVGVATAKRAIVTKSALEKELPSGQTLALGSALQPPGGQGSNLKGILYQPETGAPIPWKPNRNALPIGKMAAAATLPIMGTQRERETQ